MEWNRQFLILLYPSFHPFIRLRYTCILQLLKHRAVFQILVFLVRRPRCFELLGLEPASFWPRTSSHDLSVPIELCLTSESVAASTAIRASRTLSLPCTRVQFQARKRCRQESIRRILTRLRLDAPSVPIPLVQRQDPFRLESAAARTVKKRRCRQHGGGDGAWRRAYLHYTRTRRRRSGRWPVGPRMSF